MKYILFIIGIILGFLLSYLLPYSSMTGFAVFPLGKSIERPSPQDFVKENNIIVNDNKFTVYINNASWSSVYDTNSMDPVIDYGTNVIHIKPKKINDIGVGDIIIYKLGNKNIIHRVISTGYDEYGWYCITKGDNNPTRDTKKVRFNQIKGVVVAIIY